MYAHVVGMLQDTTAHVVHVDSLRGSLHDVLAHKEPAAVVVGEEHEAHAPRLARLVPDEARHRILVLTQHTWDVHTEVPWLVLRKSELHKTLPLLVEEAEAVDVELLASVRGDGDDSARFGSVAQVGPRFVVVAIDDPPAEPSVSFVLPGHGRIEVKGALTRTFARPGLWRITPEDESVRQALRAFTLRRSESELPSQP